ncbi:glycosyltransferase family 4 protein [bacterium]|nr:glycosyltransferase family 4 protein [candidate division CSSED10-310 bacterium]
MSRKLIAYFSPLNPVHSGIADYSEKLLPRLAQHFDLHLYGHDTPPSSPIINSIFQWFPRRNYELQRRKTPYAINLYQLGNNQCHQFIYPVMVRYPGIIFLHDANVHRARAYAHLGHKNLTDYLDEIAWCHGDDGRRIGPAIAHGYQNSILYDQFPMLKLICESASSIVVHNQFAARRVAAFIENDRIFRIPMPYADLDIPPYTEARKALEIKDEDCIIGCFGFLTPEKGIDSSLAAFDDFRRQRPNSRLILAGDALDKDYERLIRNKIQDIPGVVMTGYLDEQDFKRWLSASDICIALRYPTQGEGSDVLIRMMGAGKPVIVPAYRQFLEFPEDTCFHIPVWPNEPLAVLEALRELADNTGLSQSIAGKARRYITLHHSIDKWVTAIAETILRSMELPDIEPLSKRCNLRHVRTAPVEESIALSVYNWGDISTSPLLIDPLASAMAELGIDNES